MFFVKMLTFLAFCLFGIVNFIIFACKVCSLEWSIGYITYY
jgi:hypothetical protein